MVKRKLAKPALSVVSQDSYGSLRERLLTHIPSLSRQQKLIAEYLLDNLQEVPLLSVPQLAERSGASEATVVRLCQSIGFSGFSDMKMEVVETLRREMHSQTFAGDKETGQTADVLEAVAELERHNISTTLGSIDREAFQRVAATLFQADHIFTFGLGISANLAELAAYLFTEHGLRANRISTQFTSPREQLVTMREGDVLVAFSFPPYSRQTLEVISEAKARGMETIAITDRLAAPAVPISDTALVVSSHGMTFTNATSSTNVLLNALVVEIASQHKGDAVDALSSINRILRDRGDLVSDE
jgi:DNA-binding MurR/RpiR family transcriptional regulator